MSHKDLGQGFQWSTPDGGTLLCTVVYLRGTTNNIQLYMYIICTGGPLTALLSLSFVLYTASPFVQHAPPADVTPEGN